MTGETEIEDGASPVIEEINAGQGASRIAVAIDEADEILDPLDGLVERCAADPGAPFTQEVLERLASLQTEDRARFETLRARLRNVKSL